MTEHEAIELAVQYQKRLHRSVKISKVHWIDQNKMDAFNAWAKKSGVINRPEWMRPLAHWVVLFDREIKMLPQHYVVAVYGNGEVLETPAL